MGRKKKNETEAFVADLHDIMDGAGTMKDTEIAEAFVAKGLRSADVEPMAGWISVEERLPDCEYGAETEALLFRLKTGTVEAGYFGTGGRFRDKYFRCYHHANEGWDAKDVTHWMPMPEPPKGEKHDPDPA